MKEGWEVKKLGEVCDFQGGSQPPKNEWTTEPKEGYIRMLQIRDFTQSRSFDIEYVRFSSRLKTCNESDILLGRYGASVGKILTGLSGAYNVAIIKSIPNERIINKSYIKYFFSSQNFQQYLQIVCTQRAAQAGFSKDDINDYPITIPPLSEQSRIVEELDQLSNIIEKKRQQLSELDNLAQSIFYDMFGDPVTNEKGWEVYTLKSVTSKIGSGATPKGGNESYKDEGISLIRSLNVHNNSFKYKDLAHIDNEQAEALNNVAIECGDVLLNITGASVARCCIVPIDVLPARVNQHVSIIRGKNIINNNFLNYLLTSHAYQSLLIMLSKSNGATREALTKGQLEALKIILPPLSLQQLFAQKIEALEKQKALIKQSIAETEELFNSRMDYYFN